MVKPIYKRTWFLIVLALVIISALGKILEPKESPKYKACTNSAISLYLDDKKFAEGMRKHDADGGARLNVELKRIEEAKDAHYAGCKNKFGSK